MQKRYGLMLSLLIFTALFLLMANIGYVTAEEDDDALNGSTDDTTTNGSTEDTNINGSTEDTNINGSTEDTNINGSTEDTTKGNNSDDDAFSGKDSEDDDTKNICEINKEYEKSAVSALKCECPEGYKFVVVSQKFGPCPNKKMSDCPASILKCVNKGEIIKAAIKEKNKFKFNSTEVPANCTKTGSSMKCYLNGSRIMTIYAGNSGNVIIQTKDINASTTVQLYKDENGTLYAVTKNNKTVEVNYLPDEVKDKVKEKIKAKLHDKNMTIDENGDYEYEAEKEARFLGLFKIKEKMSWKIDAETGEVKNENAPWWGFLASDVEEDSE